jgi:hypothetical protein
MKLRCPEEVGHFLSKRAITYMLSRTLLERVIMLINLLDGWAY